MPEKALLEPAVEPEVEERELRTELLAGIPDVEPEVFLGALAPELAHAAVGRHAVVVVETHRRRVDDRAVADREKHGDPQQATGDRRGDQRVLVLGVDDVGALAPGHTADGDRRPQVEERIRQPLRRRRPPPGNQPSRERKPDNAHAAPLLARGGAPVRRHHGYPVTARGESAGERGQAPLGPTRRERREGATSRFHRLSRA